MEGELVVNPKVPKFFEEILEQVQKGKRKRYGLILRIRFVRDNREGQNELT